jgi:hypothetical protein
MMKYYLIAYMGSVSAVSWSHGNVWVYVFEGARLDFQQLKKSIAEKFKLENASKVTITMIHEISKEQFDELENE